jgi:hypothetical protein
VDDPEVLALRGDVRRLADREKHVSIAKRADVGRHLDRDVERVLFVMRRAAEMGLAGLVTFGWATRAWSCTTVSPPHQFVLLCHDADRSLSERR